MILTQSQSVLLFFYKLSIKSKKMSLEEKLKAGHGGDITQGDDGKLSMR